MKTFKNEIEVVAKAKAGDKESLVLLVEMIQLPLFHLAQKMFWAPEIAEEASQEALIRVVTQLSKFSGNSKFKTWAYRVAVNHYKNLLSGKYKSPNMSFNEFKEELDQNRSLYKETGDKPDPLYVKEVLIGCTQGMLLCLDTDARLAYLLGEIYDFSNEDCANILEIEPPTYRKRLSRAKTKIQSFMKNNCGLINKDTDCRCNKLVTAGLQNARVPKNKEDLKFANTVLKNIEDFRDDVDVFRAQLNTNKKIDFMKNLFALFEPEDK